MNTPEDEVHFLFICPALSRTRNDALHIFDQSGINFDLENANVKLAQMLRGPNIKNMGKYLESLYRERKKIIYKSPM